MHDFSMRFLYPSYFRLELEGNERQNRKIRSFFQIVMIQTTFLYRKYK